jgi:hypothetical protein
MHGIGLTRIERMLDPVVGRREESSSHPPTIQMHGDNMGAALQEDFQHFTHVHIHKSYMHTYIHIHT